MPTENDGTDRLPVRLTITAAADVTACGIRFFRARLPLLLVLLPSVLSYGVRNRQNVTSYLSTTADDSEQTHFHRITVNKAHVITAAAIGSTLL